MNLMEGLVREMMRCKDLLKMYEELEPPGIFGAAMIRDSISQATYAVAQGDTVKMARVYKQLLEHK